MAKVKFTSALKRFFPDLKELEIPGSSVSEIIQKVDANYPGLADYLIEEDGKLRKHVNIFIQNDLVTDREKLSDSVNDKDEILIFQALSGG